MIAISIAEISKSDSYFVPAAAGILLTCMTVVNLKPMQAGLRVTSSLGEADERSLIFADPDIER